MNAMPLATIDGGIKAYTPRLTPTSSHSDFYIQQIAEKKYGGLAGDGIRWV